MAKTPKKDDFVDDGRTIVNMDFESLQTHKDPKRKPVEFYRERKRDLVATDLTSKERWAIIKALYAQMIPVILILFGALALIMFLLTEFWTN